MRREVVLDTDWVTAVSVFAAVVLFALLGAGMIWTALTRAPQVPRLSWTTLFLAVAFVYLLIVTREKVLRVAVALLLFEEVLRIALVIAKASPVTIMTNETFRRVIDIIVEFGACAYAVGWLCKKVRLVDVQRGKASPAGK